MNPLRFSSRASVPILQQTEAAECGLACLAMVAGYHGFDTDLPSLRRRCVVSAQGMTLSQLMEFAARLDLSGRPLRVELDALNQLTLPAILHWDFNHFVVLVRVSANGLVLHDPAKGKIELSLAEASPHFTGVALELAPAPGFEPQVQRQRVRLRDLVGRLPGVRGAVLQVLLLALVLEVFALLLPWFSQLVLDDVVVAGDTDLLQLLVIGFGLLVFFRVSVEALRGWILMVLGNSLNLQLLSRLFRHMLQLPYGFFERRHLGDVVSRFESLNQIQRTLTGSLLEALIDGLMAICTAAMILIYSPMLALVVMVAALLYLILRLALFAPLRQATDDRIQRAARQQSNLLETVRGIQSLKLFNRAQQRRAQFQNLAVDQVNADVRLQKLHILYRLGNGLVFGLEHILVIGLGASLILQREFSVGMLVAFLAYKDQFSTRVINLIEKAIELRMLGLHAERVGDIALAEAEVDGPHVDEALSALPAASLHVSDLRFAYGDGQVPVLNNLSLEIKEGESVAIVGASGCGKTTLLKLLLGLLQPQSGSVQVGGVELKQLGLSRYRSMVGTVLQEDPLFAGSIADNICFFDPQPNWDRIQQCAQMACVHSDVQALPMGYNSLIGDMGGALSGGQKQRILLARALYKQPRFLFLDEATSHLDVAREKQVNEAIRQLKLTRIIIAHRPETIASADRVILLQQGRAVNLAVQKGDFHVA
ncbi:MAG TPA: peptidase domain-containing ABC transporter [Dongiaceae bacterium]|nr:peptidase domain-containing ABC transporter [Dongiaceae bacterium]